MSADGQRAGRRFYERYGFTPSGRTKVDEDDGTPLEELHYRMALPTTP